MLHTTSICISIFPPKQFSVGEWSLKFSINVSPSTYRTSFFFFCIFRVTPVAYEGSQARGPTGVTAAGLYHHSHSNTESEPLLQPTPQLMATRQILNPLSEARDWTHNFMVPSWICFQCTTIGNPRISFFNSPFSKLRVWSLGLDISLGSQSLLIEPPLLYNSQTLWKAFFFFLSFCLF